MFPIIADIAPQKNIRPERPMVASVASPDGHLRLAGLGVAVVLWSPSWRRSTAVRPGGLPDILMIAIPLPLTGCHGGGPSEPAPRLGSDKDEEFQAKLRTPPSATSSNGGGARPCSIPGFPKELLVDGSSLPPSPPWCC